MRTYIYCQPPAGWSLRSSTFKLICAAFAVAIMNGRRDGFMNVPDMFQNDVGKWGSICLLKLMK
jgi:hypothetical protein